MWQNAAIAGGTALIGGLLGKGKKPEQNFQEQQHLEENRFRWMVKGAQNAGFNPLTVLRSTGGQMGQMQAIESPLGSRAAIGEAIKTFGGTYAQDAIQRATEERQNEEWQRRYDYDLEKRPPLSPVPTPAPPSKENKILVGGDRAADYLITEGTLQGRYVLPIGGQYKLAPQGWVPAGLTEDLFAGLAAEVEGVSSNIKHNTWPVVSVAKDGTVRLPKAPEAAKPPLNIEIPVSP